MANATAAPVHGPRFVLRFVALLVLGEAVFVGLFLGGDAYRGYLVLYAELTGDVLRLFGHEITRTSTRLTSELCWFEVIPGCDGIQLLLLYTSAVLAFPGRVASKLVALLTGIASIFAVNLLRLVSLYLTLAYVPDAYDTLHLTVWPLILIAFVLAFWFYWATRMTRPTAIPRRT